jgi:hypothetical protein
MDAGSFVIALLTAAGAAAGPAALGAPPDASAPAARCIAAPEGERSDTDVGLGGQRDTGGGSSGLPDELIDDLADAVVGTGSGRGADTGSDSRQGTSTGSSALAEELAQELADIVAESDDPTSQRLAAALAAAGFEANATGGSGQEAAASRSDDGLDDRSNRADERGDNQRGGNQQGGNQRGSDQRDRLDEQLGQRDDQVGNDRQRDDQQRDDRLGRSQDDTSACAEQAAERDTGATRSSDLEDVLSRRSDRDQGDPDRSGSRAERDDSGIAAALERGERTAE